MQLQTYRDVVREFRTHSEAKSADVKGMVGDRKTVGLLQRRVVQETYVAHVGKEANKLEEVEAGLEHDPEMVYTEYHQPEGDEWTSTVLPMLRKQNLAALSRACNVSERQLRTLVGGRVVPYVKTQRKIIAAMQQLYR